MPKASFMDTAICEAELAAERGEVPVGAVLVNENRIIAADGNRTLELNDPTAHAEILVIRKAAEILGSERLPGCDLYVTLEPCAMCAGAISFARIGRLVFAAEDPKGGGVIHGPRFFDQPTCHWRPEVCQDRSHADEAGQLLRDFFRSRRG